MRRRVGKFKQPYAVRIALVCRYLETDASAEELAIEAGVQVSTFRRWVRDLRGELESASLKVSRPVSLEQVNTRQGQAANDEG